MNLRKVVSLTALLSFIVILLTSILLYIAPHGRVAYWSSWTLWGLSKTQWANLHVNIGFLFLVTMFVHTYLNFKAIVNYLKNKAKNLVVFTKEFNLALVLFVLFCVGTYFEFAPFSWILNISESFKQAAAKKYGDPPYGHAELSSLKTFTMRVDIDLANAKQNLKKAGVVFENDKQSVMEIAEQNGITPKQVYEAMQPAGGQVMGVLPKNPEAGLGMLTLNEICEKYGVELSGLLTALEQEQITASGDMTMRDIAQQNHMSPADVYVILQGAEVIESF